MFVAEEERMKEDNKKEEEKSVRLQELNLPEELFLHSSGFVCGY
jgi:hypothetical protein